MDLFLGIILLRGQSREQFLTADSISWWKITLKIVGACQCWHSDCYLACWQFSR